MANSKLATSRLHKSTLWGQLITLEAVNKALIRNETSDPEAFAITCPPEQWMSWAEGVKYLWCFLQWAAAYSSYIKAFLKKRDRGIRFIPRIVQCSSCPQMPLFCCRVSVSCFWKCLKSFGKLPASVNFLFFLQEKYFRNNKLEVKR